MQHHFTLYEITDIHFKLIVKDTFCDDYNSYNNTKIFCIKLLVELILASDVSRSLKSLYREF